LAFALGLALAYVIFPPDFLFPAAGAAWRPAGDAAQHIVAQRYLIEDAWRLPPTFAANLNTQEGGMNTAFADSIPALALGLKALRHLLPDGFHGVGLFYGIAWVLQPVAAVWALRGTGERRLLPALGIALAAISMPAWIGRFGHAALTGHFLLLLALGFYVRLVRKPSGWLWLGAWLLQVLALLIHPYLAAMTLALLGAVPATRLLRGDRFMASMLATGVALALVIGTMAAFDYLGAAGDGGFGMFAMNLLSPVWPAGSGIIGWPWSPQLDATGHGGWEGYNWLGLGLLGGLALGVLLAPVKAIAMAWRHPGLLLVLLALTALAVSHRVGFGERIVLDLGSVPGFMEQFRASGRFFWPVAYALLLGAMVLLARRAPVLCVLVGLAQFADAGPLRAAIAGWAAQRTPWTVPAADLRAAFAQSRRLTLLPSWPCIEKTTGDATYAQLLEVLTLAAEYAIPASTMYVARWHTQPVCRDTTLAAKPLAAGELRLILPSAQAALAPLVPGGAKLCAPLGALIACRYPAPAGR
jgi:hypothetical protein